MDILDELRTDHRNVRELLDRLVATDTKDKELWNNIVASLRDELIPHARAEEAILYNSLRDCGSDEARIGHAYTEHMEAEGILRTLQVTDAVGFNWKAAAEKLKDALEHHIAEEETTVFAAARNAFNDEERAAMGEAFLRMKPEVQDDTIVGNTFDMIVNMMPKRLRGSIRPSAPRSPESKAS
jgi:hemerythrin-like domain-containing protein